MAHDIATSLMILHQGLVPEDPNEVPWWLLMGYAYYMDFFLFERTGSTWGVKFYADYDQQNMDIALETLDLRRHWAPVLKRLTQRDRASTLDDIFSADLATLTPETLGFMYAFMAYLVNDPARAERFAQALLLAAENNDPNPQKFLAQTLGFPNLHAIQEDWHRFILDRAFP